MGCPDVRVFAFFQPVPPVMAFGLFQDFAVIFDHRCVVTVNDVGCVMSQLV